MNILTLNAGSSSIKYKVFKDGRVLISGLIEGISEAESTWSHRLHATSPLDEKQHSETRIFLTHEEAFQALGLRLQEDLGTDSIQGVGHRVVHGGKNYFKPTLITARVLEDIQALAKLAPLHNPINAAGIEFALKLFSQAKQFAIFDTGFHHSMPTFVSQYAIDPEVTKAHQIQRYGFHGINHEYVAETAAKFLKKPLAQCHFINLHLGNGASACLIKQGQSFDTTMGMTPLAGLIMGTRCGDIDPAIPLYLLQQGFSGSEIDVLLNKKSGLKGLAQDNDMRNLLARREQGDKDALLAIDMYVYSIQKTIGAYLSQVENLDALIFTGGIGENAAFIRQKILASLTHFGFALDSLLNEERNAEPCRALCHEGKKILLVRGDEEALIAEKVAENLKTY